MNKPDWCPQRVWDEAVRLVFIIATSTWGLLPMNLALWIVYGRNHWKWNRT